MQTVTARAHTNIALIKYWGKKDAKLILPFTDSVSLTLDDFYTDTTVAFDQQLTADTFSLNGQPLPLGKVAPFMALIRQRAGISDFAHISSINHVPTAAGLASSASAFAALALAASTAAGLHLAPVELSRLARRGSGSATRSVYGGLSIWHRGDDDATSYATALPATTLDLRMLVVMVSTAHKTVSSRNLMANTVATSPYYPAWIEHNQQAASQMVAALAANDFQAVGHLTEQSSMQMHAAILAGDPAFTYWQPETLRAWALVRQLRASGIGAYATMDAGPNVKVLTQAKDVDAVQAALLDAFPERVIVAKPGPGARILKEAQNV